MMMNTSLASLIRHGAAARHSSRRGVVAAASRYCHLGTAPPSAAGCTTDVRRRGFSSKAPISVDDSIHVYSDPFMMKATFRETLEKERQKALLGGGKQRLDRQHERGKLSARERLELFFDPGTFHELDQLKAHRCTEFGMDDPKNRFPGDGIVTGHGLVHAG